MTSGQPDRLHTQSQQFCMRIDHLLVLASNYPSPAQPTYGTFVREFARAVARQGVRTSVIAPVAIQRRARWPNGFPQRSIEKVEQGNELTVFRPAYLSVSAREQFSRLGPLNPSLLTLRQFTSAVRRVVKREHLAPDAVYGHFLYLPGASAVHIGQELDIPSFPCMGEGEFWTVRRFGFARAREELKPAQGFIANSTALKGMLQKDLLIPPDSIGVFPNGTDLSKFKPHPMLAARRHFGLPEEPLLVCSVGNFLEGKGVARVAEAIDALDGVQGVFAGSGPVPPRCANTALCRRVSHDEIPLLLSACDVFALPTVIEGSSNALVEAMACGLPIISSLGEFNDDLLTPEVAIRLDPYDVSALRNAVVTLRDGPELRRKMAAAALARAAAFDVSERARRILQFMHERMETTRGSHSPAARGRAWA